jgi:hypothetical protein
LNTSGRLRVNLHAARLLLRCLGYPLVPKTTITPTYTHILQDDEVDQKDVQYLRRITLSEQLRLHAEDLK